MTSLAHPTLDEPIIVRYLVDDVQAAINFYTTYLGFTVHDNFAPNFADITRGHLRLWPRAGLPNIA